jgi:hypothetical protein
VSAYVESELVRFDVDIWNVYECIASRLPRTNNHVEGYNRRMNVQYATYPHLFQVVEILWAEHEYQYHAVEDSQIQLQKRKKVNDDVDIKLAVLHDEYKSNKSSDILLAIICGHGVQ